MSPWSIRTENLRTSSCAEFLEFILTSFDIEVGPLMLVYSSCLIEQTWRMRNEIKFQSKTFNLLWLHKLISAQYRESQESNENKTPRIHQKQWLPPPEGWMKINSDACMRENGSVGATLARNRSGSIVRAHATFLDFEDPLVAESAALLSSIGLALDNGFENVIFEVDCEVLARAINNSMDDLSWDARSVLMDCKQLLQQLTLWEVDWVPREVNCDAHNVAIWCKNSNVSGLLQISSLPPPLCNLG
ncbi:Ribonuclease H-like domain containing protein [Trema orientale]|uniref:Ribonuclease H-like domain containing protein n=1 Tax=Trema orientale TaxID=63057 RepID=A0A2P5FHA4_TREOI|nr:Ribonuclease H-like domain containing protein [Trema orientale]